MGHRSNEFGNIYELKIPGETPQNYFPGWIRATRDATGVLGLVFFGLPPLTDDTLGDVLMPVLWLCACEIH